MPPIWNGDPGAGSPCEDMKSRSWYNLAEVAAWWTFTNGKNITVWNALTEKEKCTAGLAFYDLYPSGGWVQPQPKDDGDDGDHDIDPSGAEEPELVFSRIISGHSVQVWALVRAGVHYLGIIIGTRPNTKEAVIKMPDFNALNNTVNDIRSKF